MNVNVNKKLSGLFDNILEIYNKPPTTIQRSNIPKLKFEPKIEPKSNEFNNQLLINFICQKNSFKRFVSKQNNTEYLIFIQNKDSIINHFSWIYTYIIKNIDTIIDQIYTQTLLNNNSIVIFKHFKRLSDMINQDLQLASDIDIHHFINNIVLNDIKQKLQVILGDTFDVLLYDNLPHMKHKTFIILKW